MGNLTKYFKRKIQDYLFGLVSYTPPANYYVGLLTSYNSATDSYTEGTYTGYSRVVVPNNKTSFNISTDTAVAEITNATAITFPMKEGGADVTVTHIGYFDALTGGNLLFVGKWDVIVQNYDRVIIEANGLSIKVLNG